jgi:hypothetical protein
MPKRPIKDRDFAVNALRVVEQAIGEHMDGTPLEDSDLIQAPKNIQPTTAKRGHARAAALTPQRRSTIAAKAAQVRWGSQVDSSKSHPQK